MSLTNFPMSMADIEALATFGDHRMTNDQLLRLVAKGKEAREWLNSFHIRNDAPVSQPKEPA